MSNVEVFVDYANGITCRQWSASDSLLLIDPFTQLSCEKAGTTTDAGVF